MKTRTHILNKILLVVMLLVGPFVYGQSGNIAINSSGVSPNSSAILDLSSNTNGGFLLPSLSTANISALGTVSNSLLIYNSTSTCYQQYLSSCSCWQVIFCPCTNAPATPGAITGNTTPCGESDPPGAATFSSTSAYSISPVNDATSYSWIITPSCAGDMWSGFVSNGNLSIANNPTFQDITWFQDCSYTVSVAAVNACGTSAFSTLDVTVTDNTVPSTPVITGPATICTGSSNTYTASSGAATSYTWTVPATVGASFTGQGTATITVTAAAAAGGPVNISVTGTSGPCGTSAAGTYAVTVDAPPAAPTITGPASIIASSTTNTYTATSAGATSFTWTVPATVGASFTGQGTATITVTAAAAAGGPGNITATATGTCGTSAASANKAVTVTACGTITADATAASGDLNNSFTITTTVPYDLVIISCDGVYGAFNGSVSVVPPTGAVPTTTPYASATDNSADYADLAIYSFVAQSAGVYTINVNEGTEWPIYGYANFAVALTGFCGVPSAANIHNPATISNGSANNCQGSLSANLTEIAGSYAIGCFTDFWCDPAPPTNPTWTNLTSISGTFDNNDAYGFAGAAIGAAATPPIKATQSPGENYGVLYLLDVH